MRNTKTEYVSCPSCGRTLFNLQASAAAAAAWRCRCWGRRLHRRMCRLCLPIQAMPALFWLPAPPTLVPPCPAPACRR